MNKIEQLLNSFILTGFIVLLIGLYFIVYKAGLPYQDPTIEMVIRQEAYNMAGESCMLSGGIILAIGITTRAILIFAKRNTIKR
ncbi:MAG: hypothetical protein CVU97_01315 [Firmicutes bacterium HGW-Firmicutes-21]|nr:MAG: hypothetical protein CVU97_01315 [Firmicutes bacterium HGW-Firmicutes-21]